MGNEAMLRRQLPQLANITDHHRFMAAAMKLAQQGMHQQEAAGQTLEGKWAKLQQTVGKLLTTLGQMLLPIIEAVVDGLTDMIGSVADTADGTADWGKTTTSVCEWVKKAFAEVKWQWTEIGNSAAIVWVCFEVALSQIWDACKNTFTNSLTIVNWFFDNFWSIAKDAANMYMTVWSNVVDNIKSIFSNVWNWLTGSKKPKEAMKGLLDGFVAETKKMPELKNIFEKSGATKDLEAQAAGLFTQRDKDGEQFHQNELARQATRAAREKADHEEANNIKLDVLGKGKSDSKKEGGFSDLLSAWKNLQGAAVKKDNTPHDTLVAVRNQHQEAIRQTKLLEQIAKSGGRSVAVAG